MRKGWWTLLVVLVLCAGAKSFVEDVDIKGTLKAAGLTYPSADGTVGKAVITNGSGTLSLGTPVLATNATNATNATSATSALHATLANRALTADTVTDGSSHDRVHAINSEDHAGSEPNSIFFTSGSGYPSSVQFPTTSGYVLQSRGYTGIGANTPAWGPLTFSTIQSWGLTGTGASQVAVGNHTHSSVASAANATYATSSTYAVRASTADSATYATSAGIAVVASTAGTATSAATATRATSAATADWATSSSSASHATLANRASLADAATYATAAGTAVNATYAAASNYSATAGSVSSALSANYATSAGYALTAGSAGAVTTATYAVNAGKLNGQLAAYYLATGNHTGTANTLYYADGAGAMSPLTYTESDKAKVLALGGPGGSVYPYFLDQQQMNVLNATNALYATTATFALATAQGSATELYFDNVASDISTYETMRTYAVAGTEVVETVAAASGSGEVLIDAYATAPGVPGITVIPSGIWQFVTFASASSVTGNTYIRYKVYKRSVAGTETALWTDTVQTADIDASSIGATPYICYHTQAADIALLATDRIVVKVYAYTDHVSSRNVSWAYQGTTHSSHISTPATTVMPSFVQKAWTPLTPSSDFASLMPSSSTITMSSDWSGTIKAGMPVKIVAGGTTYYALATTMASGLMTLSCPAGMHSPVTALSYGSTSMTEEVDLFVSGDWGDGTNTALLDSDMKTAYVWRKGPAYLVYVAAANNSAYGATQPKLTVRLGSGGDQVLSATNALQPTTAKTFVSTAGSAKVDASKYDLVFGDPVEIECTAAKTGTAGSDLTVQLVFVKEN